MTTEYRALLKRAVHQAAKRRAQIELFHFGSTVCDHCDHAMPSRPGKAFCSERCRKNHYWLGTRKVEAA